MLFLFILHVFLYFLPQNLNSQISHIHIKSLMDIENEVQSHAAFSHNSESIGFHPEKSWSLCFVHLNISFCIHPQYNYTFAVEESAAKRLRPSLPAGGASAAQWSEKEDDGWYILPSFSMSLSSVREFKKSPFFKPSRQSDVGVGWIIQLFCLFSCYINAFPGP